MRLTVLTLAILALTACGNKDQADKTRNADENLTAESIVANDVTAIDAVTADAANMAADVDIGFTNEFGATNDSDSPAKSGTRQPREALPRRTAPTPAPASEPPADAAGNVTQ